MSDPEVIDRALCDLIFDIIPPALLKVIYIALSLLHLAGDRGMQY